MIHKWVLALALAGALGVAHARRKVYNTQGQPYSEDVLQVHVVPHTHDDVGWLKTVDQYYYGANNTIQHAGVQYILDSLIPELAKNPDRKFMYVEIAFFARWFTEQTDEVQQLTRKLVDNGQLTFVNGGWCMHDEAATHYVAMVDQTTLGHTFLKRELNFIPRAGWQIDPFGHSSTQASLLSWGAGFDALFFGRIDYQDRELRQANAQCEGVWRASPSLGKQAQVFWGLTGSYGGNYGPPSGFNFDLFNDGATPVMDDERLQDYNVDERVDDFVAACLSQANQTQGNHIMLTMGSDFQYESSAEWYTNLDKLIHYVNLDGRVNAFYSNPNQYMEAKNEEGIDWQVKTDDFFPYADCEHCYWTGYFTSRPNLKRYERQMSGYLQAARQVEALARVGIAAPDANADASSPLALLEEASGVAQHHDAVSGTSKQHVAYDYAMRLAAGYNQASDEVFTVGLAELAGLGDGVSLAECSQLNVSVCAATAGAGDDAVTVVAYNPSAAPRSTVLRVPVARDDLTVVAEFDGSVVAAQVLPTAASPAEDALPFTLAFDTGDIAPLSTASFVVSPTDATTDATTGATTAAQRSDEILVAHAAHADTDNFDVSNGVVTLTFSQTTGRVVSMTRVTDDGTTVSTTLDQAFYYYTSYNSSLPSMDLSDCDPETGEDCPAGYTTATLHHHKELQRLDGVGQHRDIKSRRGGYGASSEQSSGAYIFRPSEADQTPFAVEELMPDVTVVKGDQVVEVRQVWAPWLNQTIRLAAGAAHAEFEWTVGAIPIDDLLGKEVISKFSSGVASGDSVFTDSNGREFLERTLNQRPTWDVEVSEPVAGNYYPVNMGIFVKDDTAQLSVLTDRSQGGASLAEGEIELMVHRRTLVDDSRGVGEPINETCSGMTSYADTDCAACREGTGMVARGSHFVLLDPPSSAMSHLRPLAEEVFAPIAPAFAVGSTRADAAAATAGPGPRSLRARADGDALLPANVKLMTLQAISNKKVLFRLEHMYAVDEDNKLSKPVAVDLVKLMDSLGLASDGIYEMTLTGNQARNKLKYLDWSTADGKVPPGPQETSKPGNQRVVKLTPQEIRTFVAVLA